MGSEKYKAAANHSNKKMNDEKETYEASDDIQAIRKDARESFLHEEFNINGCQRGRSRVVVDKAIATGKSKWRSAGSEHSRSE